MSCGTSAGKWTSWEPIPFISSRTMFSTFDSTLIPSGSHE
jgi:hypothetical protein